MHFLVMSIIIALQYAYVHGGRIQQVGKGT